MWTPSKGFFSVLLFFPLLSALPCLPSLSAESGLSPSQTTELLEILQDLKTGSSEVRQALSKLQTRQDSLEQLSLELSQKSKTLESDLTGLTPLLTDLQDSSKRTRDQLFWTQVGGGSAILVLTVLLILK